MLIERTELATLIPHAGTMCLLDGVLSWDDRTITCVTRSHQAIDNPLRADGSLASVNAIEYGAQAAAVHGGLLARTQGQQPPLRYLAGIRNAILAVRTLDDIAEPLCVTACLLHADAAGAIYQTILSAGGSEIAAARVSIINRPIASSQP